MKIKNKLIAGGLMSVVACALVGSITGTFAWYQYSTKATVSMHGKSVGTSKNLQIKIGDGEFESGNLTWNEIAATLDNAVLVDEDDVDEGYEPLLLKPLSNGGYAEANDDGKQPLNTRTIEAEEEEEEDVIETAWWGNPEGGLDLPEASDGFIQFKFNVRYVESDGTTITYPEAELYITDIGSKIVNTAKDMRFALRVHIQFGEGDDAKYCLFNPFVEDDDDVDLIATISDELDTNVYDWEEAQEQVYQLPQDRYTAAEAEEDESITAGAYKNEHNTLHSLSHEEVLQTIKADGSIDEEDDEKVSVTIPGSEDEDYEGIEVTVTAWLEGFAIEPDDDDNETTEDNWWNTTTTVGSDLLFGFQLSGFKA